MRRVLAIALSGLMLFGSGFSGSGTGKNNKANALYQTGHYSEALKLYHEAQEADPDNPEIAYNTANTLHKRNDFGGAQETYARALATEDPAFQNQLFYNLGNNFYRLQMLDEAQTAYERALLVNPDDEDAKFNLEFIKQVREQPEEEQPEESQSDQNEEEEEKEGEGGGEKDEEDPSGEDEGEKKPSGGQGEDEQEQDAPRDGEGEEEEEDQEDQESEGGSGDGQEEAQNASPEPPTEELPESDMNREDAQRILDAWEGRESNLRGQRKARLRAAPPAEVEKDW